MKNNQILTLNNLVFKIAQKQKIKEYLSIMKYSNWLEGEYKTFTEDCDVIKRNFKTEKKNFKDQQGREIEYMAIPAVNIDKCDDELKKIGEIEFTNQPKSDKAGQGKSLFNNIISKMDITEITGSTKETRNGEEVELQNYSYQEQKLISEILETIEEKKDEKK